MTIQIILAAISTFCFAVMFNVPRGELVFAGFVGALGWFFYQLFFGLGLSIVSCTFISTIVITLVSRILTVYRKMPITLFLIPGIIPLVPGAGIYGTMYHAINNDIGQATAKGIETFKISGVISLGIMVVLAIPVALFSIDRKRSRYTETRKH